METNKETEVFEIEDIDTLFTAFDGVVVEGGADPAEDDEGCAGGACKI